MRTTEVAEKCDSETDDLVRGRIQIDLHLIRQAEMMTSAKAELL
jgi:hypothetical protein